MDKSALAEETADTGDGRSALPSRAAPSRSLETSTVVPVSVVVPVHNCAHLLPGLLESCRAQTARPLEIIVVDDGSTRPYGELLAELCARPGVTLMRLERRGPAAARNAGARRAVPASRYLLFLDADDQPLASMLERLFAALEGAAQASLAFCNVLTVDDARRPVHDSYLSAGCSRAPSLDDLLRHSWPILTSAALIRRRAFEQSGGFCEDFTARGFEDPLLWLRLRELGEFRLVPERLLAYRTLPAHERVLKYAAGYRPFVRQLREIYGLRARRLAAATARGFASGLGHRGLLALAAGDRATARRCFVAALGYQPLNPRIALRLARTFLPLPWARLLSGSSRRSSRPLPQASGGALRASDGALDAQLESHPPL